MEGNNNSDSVRIAIVSALTAISIGLLAIIHSSEKILGLFVVGGGFVASVYNFVVLLLLIEVLIGIAFLLSTGFVYGFSDEKHGVAELVRRKAYSLLVAVFPVSFISVVYNTVIKLSGLDSLVGIILAVVVVILLVVLIGVVLVGKRWVNGPEGKGRDRK